jgi:hypothetical protein
MNGLLIRDYVHHGLGTNPIRFAEQYYLNYPKIAPLMWPPLFHLVLGLSLLPGWPAAPTALFLVGLTAAWATWRLHRIVRELAGPAAGLVAAGLFLTTPMVMEMGSVVMLDVVIAALSLEATYWLARYVRSTSSRDAALYGVFTALACLTKGNGVSVVLVPAIVILITGRFDLLRRAGLYIAAAIVLVFAVPLLAISARFDAGIGDFAQVTPADVIDRIALYDRYLWTNIGAVSLALAVLGAVAVTARARRRQNADAAVPLAEALIALAVAAILFHLTNPHRVAVGRYITLAMAPIIGLSMVGALVVAQKMRADAARRVVFAVIVGVVLIAAVANRPWLARRRPLGYSQIVGQLAAADRLAGRRLLVVSDEVGEGSAVTEAAVLNLQPAPTIVRGSKLLGNENWVGDHSMLTYASPTALMQELEDLHIEYVLIDRSGHTTLLPYFEQVRALTEGGHDRLERMDTAAQNVTTGPTHQLELYRVKTKSLGPPKSLQISLAYTLGRTLQQ